MTTITRRSRLMACVTYTPKHPASISECTMMTPRQIMREYRDLRQRNSNASVFVTLYHKGIRVPFHSWQFSGITDYYDDAIELEAQS